MMLEGENPPRREVQTRTARVLISRVSRVDGCWRVEDAPLTFDDGDPAYAQAVGWAKAWRAEDPEGRCYVVEELPVH